MKTIVFVLGLLLMCTHQTWARSAIKLSPQIEKLASENPQWKELIAYIVKNGKTINVDIFTYLSIENTKYDRNGMNHNSEYLSLVGFEDHEGNFYASHLEAVSENWTVNEKSQWQIDQWLHKLNGDASYVSGAHVEMIQTFDREVLKHEFLPTELDKLTSNWETKLLEWYQFINLNPELKFGF